jgi:antitoxin MazE
MKSRLVSMGNSRGVRIPKPLIDQVGLVDEVELLVRDGTIVIQPARAPREGWAEAAASVSEGLLDPELPTRFDEDEWQW